MARVIIQELLLFLLPTVMYVIYLSWARQRALAAGRDVPEWHAGPWYWLILAGGVLVVLSLAVLAIYGGSGPEAVYEPATLEGGKIVPGRASE